MKALITGASSLLGFRITEAMLRKGHRVMALYQTHDIRLNSRNLIKVKLDIRNHDSLAKVVSEFRPNVILHASAPGGVDACEKYKALAWGINVEGTRAVTRIAKRLSSFLTSQRTTSSTSKESDILRAIHHHL